jgi:Spy/CpxP family protein refolding chaperone
MKTKMKFNNGLLILLLVGLPFFNTAQPKKPHQKEHPGIHRPVHPPKFDFTKLDLSEDQQGQIEKINIDHMEKSMQLHNQIRELETQLQTIRMSIKVDLDVLIAKTKELGNLRTEMMVIHELHYQKIRQVLNREQRIRFDAFRPRQNE